VEQIKDTTHKMAEIISKEGLPGLFTETIKSIYSQFIEWTQGSYFELNTFRLGLVTGFGFVALQLLLPQYEPILAMSSFATKFSLSEPAPVLLTIVSKMNVEILHQVEGPLTTTKTMDRIFNFVEKVIDVVSVPILLFSEQYFLLGIALADAAKTFAFSITNPFL
jgi:hypothetical protein